MRLLFNPLINLAVKEDTGTKLLGETDSTDLVPTRVALPTVSGGNKILKDPAPKHNIIEGKAINLETPETSGLPKEPHLPTHSDITAKTKIVEKTSMLANKVEQELPTSSTNILYQKQYIDTVEKINERYPINADLAGQKYPLPEALQELYPEGVWLKKMVILILLLMQKCQ